MKQAIALLLAVYMLLAVLAGCTAKTTTDAEPAPSTTEQETSSETQTPAEAEQAGPVELGLMLWEASEAETEPIDRGIKNYEEASGNQGHEEHCCMERISWQAQNSDGCR